MDNLPTDLLLVIVSIVATNSLQDLMNLMMVSKSLKEAALNPKVLRVASLRGVDTVQSYYNSDEKNLFLQKLNLSLNPEYYVREGCQKLHKGEVEAATKYFKIASSQGHDYAKYAYGNLLVLSNNKCRVAKGQLLLMELFYRGCLFTSRETFCVKVGEVWNWRSPPLPLPLQYNIICKENDTCGGVWLVRGGWAPFSEDNIQTQCVNCRIDAEVQYFLHRIKFSFEATVDHFSNLRFTHV